MKIGVISDTHRKLKLAEEVLLQIDGMDLLIHLGDHYKDGIALQKRLNIEVIGVKGNCDLETDIREEIVTEIGRHKLLLVHGHQYGVKTDLSRLYYKALELGCDIALFGHTHIPLNIKHDGVLFMNPGSLSYPRGGSTASYGVLKLEKDKVSSQIISFERSMASCDSSDSKKDQK